MAITEVVDYVVVGAGIAGLRAAIELSRAGRVLVLTKEELGESNTQYAQGGIAVALEGEQDVALHYEDTLAAGDGLVDPLAAAVLVEEGPERVLELLRWGTNFDRKDGELMRTREGAHSRSRILHANGDATGREIGRALLEHARMQPHITLREYTTSVDLIVAEGTVRGVTMLQPDGEIAEAHARAVLLASGGAGQVYSETTNPTVATGDGIAMAYRAGAEVADMEFYQFHPTALSLPGVPRFLLSEALRGEGAYLRNARMERFMERYHPQMELAPRDVVARAITREGLAAGPGGALPVYLDMRHVTDSDLTARFPGISWFLRQNGLDLKRDLIPVRPAAHYLMGGVRTGIDGRSSLPRLYAAGEAACTSVHGANRLASNSLLEGLVFGARAARFMLEETEASGIAGGAGSPARSGTLSLLRCATRALAELDVAQSRSFARCGGTSLGSRRISGNRPRASGGIRAVRQSSFAICIQLRPGSSRPRSGERRAAARISATIFRSATISTTASTRSFAKANSFFAISFRPRDKRLRPSQQRSPCRDSDRHHDHA